MSEHEGNSGQAQKARFAAYIFFLFLCFLSLHAEVLDFLQFPFKLYIWSVKTQYFAMNHMLILITIQYSVTVELNEAIVVKSKSGNKFHQKLLNIVDLQGLKTLLPDL